MIDIFSIFFNEIALWWMPQNLTENLLTSVQVMALVPSGNKPLPEPILFHWGRVTHICVSKLTIIGSDNGLSPDRRQAIICTKAGLLSIGP